MAACSQAGAQSRAWADALPAGQAPAQPSGDVPGLSQTGAGQELYLDVVLNGVATGQLVRFVRQKSGFFIDANSLRELGLKWPQAGAVSSSASSSAPSSNSAGLVHLDSLPGLELVYDSPRQRISLLAPVALLDRPTQAIGDDTADRPVVDPLSLVPGLLVNYDLYGQHTQGVTAVSAATEMRLFGVGPGLWSNTMLSQASRADANAAQARGRNVRLDTFWQHDFADDMTTLTVGDTATGSLPWTRGLRIGGLRLSRNFSLQPYRVTAPLAAFEGSAVLPSTVDLFINGMRQSSQQVQPGEFRLNTLPSLNGSGQAQMVITDLNGQRRVVSFDLYGAPQLLQRGLSDWSLDAGLVRRDYGLRSFSYDSSPVVSASLRHGWSDRTTLEAHAEAASGLQLAGAGGVWLLGEQAGVLSAAAAFSRSNPLPGHQRAGGQGTLGYQWNSALFNVSLNTLRAGSNYRDTASLYQAATIRASDSAYLGVGGEWGQFGLSLISQQYSGAEAVKLASLSWSRQLAGESTLSLGMNRNFGGNGASAGTSLYAAWSMPLDRRTSFGVGYSRDGQRSRAVADAARSLPGDGDGWGWRVQAVAADSASGQAEISHAGRYGQWSGGVSYLRGQGGADTSALFGSASGGVVLMRGRAQAMRRVDDAFAVVSTDGVPDVPVRLENRLVGQTDALGLLFVTRLNAYQRNRLSIDTLELPADMRIGREVIEAVPPARSGMLAQFEIRRILALSMGLRDVRGNWVAPGSVVTVESPGASGDNPALHTMVGYDGLVYLENPPPNAILRVQTPAGICRTAFAQPSETRGTVDLGTLTCR